MTTGILIPGRSGKNDALQGKLKVKNSHFSLIKVPISSKGF